MLTTRATWLSSKNRLNMHIIKSLFAALLLCLIFVLAPLQIAAAESFKKELDYLISLSEKHWLRFDPANLTPLLKAIDLNSQTPKKLPISDFESCTKMYYEFTIPVPLDKAVLYLYHPDIPGYLPRANSVRLQSSPKDDNLEGLVSLITSPVAPGGQPQTSFFKEFQETTPATSTGTYYNYTENRFMARLNHDGHDVLISVSTMPETSGVGRKGAIIGPDSDWRYFYSGQNGLTWGGPSSIDTYIYTSASVQFMFEPSPGTTRVCLFKWMRAGWKSINFVEEEHIREGCERLAKCLRQTLASPNLPTPEEIKAKYQTLKNMTDSALREEMRPVVDVLVQASATDKILSESAYKSILQSGAYLENMTRTQMIAELMKRYFHDKIK